MQILKYILLILVFTTSCKTKTSSKNTKVSEKDLHGNVFDNSTLVSQIDTIFDPNAPKRITRNIKLDNEGRLLIAAYDDIIRYNGESFAKIKKPEGLKSWYAFDVLEDRDNNIWIASDELGAFRIDSKTRTVTNFTTKDGLGHLRNMCVYEDKNGNIWIGGQGGLSKYDGTSFKNFTIKDGLPHNDINTILEDSHGNIWFGTRGNAGIYDGNKFSELRSFEGKSFFNVWSIIEDKSDNIWLVDSTGLWKFKNGIFTHKLKEVWKIHEDSNHSFWLTGMLKGGASTLKRIDGDLLTNNDFNAIEVFKSDKMFFGIMDDKKGNIWVGGGSGIWRYNGETIQFYTGSNQ